jgi:hypothetical protein
MDNAARTRQRVLALFLPIAAALYIGAEALSPKGTDQVVQTTASAFKVLAIAAKHPTQLYVAGSLALLGLGALAVSYAAIAALVRDRGSAVATVAALIGGIGAFCGAIVNVLVFPNLAAAATAHLTRDEAARFLVTTSNPGSATRSFTPISSASTSRRPSWDSPSGEAEAFRAGWRSCSSSAWKSLNSRYPPGSSPSCTCCHSR